MADDLRLDAVQRYMCVKHHISPCSSAQSIDQVAESLVGLHSARLPSPYVILHARIPCFRPEGFQQAFLQDRSVIKLRCMRRTLHTIPLHLAPILHQATLSLRRADCLRAYRRLNASRRTVLKVQEEVIASLSSEPMPPRALEQRVASVTLGSGRSICDVVSLARAVVKDLWESGILCYLNTSTAWGSEARRYGLTSRVYPTLDLNSVEPTEAQQRLVLAHISQYGPVSLADIVWWSGLSVREVQQALHAVKSNLVELRLEGCRDNYYMVEDDHEAFRKMQPFDSTWVKFLAYEDSSLKGYFRSRHRYISEAHYDILFNTIGEARASIMADGRVIGVWSWNKSHGRVEWNTFVEPSAGFRKLIEDEAEKTTAFLQ